MYTQNSIVTQEYWRHSKSGEIYAVRVERWADGMTGVVEACGPLHHSEVRRDLLEEWSFDSDRELVDDLDRDQDAYVLHEVAE